MIHRGVEPPPSDTLLQTAIPDYDPTPPLTDYAQANYYDS